MGAFHAKSEHPGILWNFFRRKIKEEKVLV